MEPESKAVETDNKENTIKKPEATPAPVTQATEPAPETKEQINWRKFREAREIERKEKIAAEKRAAEKEAEAQALKAAMESLLNKPTNQSKDEYLYSNPEEPTEEERIQKLVAHEINKYRKIEEEEKIRREQAEFPARLNQTYHDFNQVCSTDNLDYLEYHYPEIADAFKKLPDGFDKWSNLYKTVKRFVPNTESKKDQSKAEKNFNKPQAMSIAGKTQVGDTAPIQLDEKRRADNWARMQKVMRGG